MIPGSLEVLTRSWHQLQGVVRWTNHNGFTVLQVHHSADPAKDDAWAEEAAKRFPGGREGKGWRSEMDIDWGAKQGGPVYPEFGPGTHVIPDFEIPVEWTRFRAIDPGYANPCACVWMAIDGDGTCYVYDEHYQRGHTIKQNASAIKARTGRQEIEYTLMDPSSWNKTLEGGGASIATNFAKAGVAAQPGNHRLQDGLDAVRELLLLQDNGEPRLKVLDTCVNAIWEFLHYRYPELTPDQKSKQDEKEKPLKKNDHLMDCIRYLIMTIPRHYLALTGKEDPHTKDVYLSTLSQRARRRMAGQRVEVDDDDWDD